MSKPALCAATTRASAPCPNRALPDSRFCFSHDPAVSDPERRREAGRQRSNAARARKRLGISADPLTMREVDAMLCGALAGLLAGELEPGVVTAAATAGRAIVAVRSASEFESRLAALESRMGIASNIVAIERRSS